MSDYDAFGRKKEDDPLEDLGWSSSGSSTPEQAPSIEVSSTSPAHAGHSPPPMEVPQVSIGSSPPNLQSPIPTVPVPSSRGGGLRMGWALGWIISLLILGGIAFGVYSAVDAGRDTVKDITDTFTIDTSPGGSNDGGAADDAPDEELPADTPVKDPKALTSRAGLARGIKLLEAEVPGKIDNFRVEAARIDVIVHKGNGGKRTIAQLQADAEVPQIIATQDTGIAPTDTVRYSDIDPAAPSRLIRASGERLGKSPKKVNYLVFSRFAGTLQWGLYYKDGAITIGDAHGRYQRRIS